MNTFGLESMNLKFMKRILPLALVVLIGIITWQCSNNKDFSVSGKLIGGENDTLVIEEMIENGLSPVTTIYTDEAGAFSYTDTAANPRFLFLKIQNKYLSLLLLNGQNVELSGDLSNINQTFEVKGSRESELIWDLNREMQSAALKLDSLATVYQAQALQGETQDADAWFSKVYQDLISDQKEFIKQFINKNYDSPASLMALSHQLNRQAILNPATDFVYFAKVDSSLSEQYPDSRMVRTLHNWVMGQQQQQAIQSAEQQSAGIGSIAPDIKLPNPDGEMIALSSLRGKYVLLDFWAAWCAPCRRENPNLVRAYAKYKDKGFEIFQVSLDRTKEDWVGAIKSDKLNWTHVSDLKYWGSPVAKLFYVSSIPASFLLDPEGKIIAKNLRGAALDQKLAEILD